MSDYSEPVQKLMNAAIKGYDEFGVIPFAGITLNKCDGKIYGCLIGSAAFAFGWNGENNNSLPIPSKLESAKKVIQDNIPSIANLNEWESKVITAFDGEVDITENELTRMTKQIKSRYLGK